MEATEKLRDSVGRMTRALGEVLNRPAFMPAPSFMVRLVLGELGDILLTGQRVIPKKLQGSGFQFKYPEIRGALRDLLKSLL